MFSDDWLSTASNSYRSSYLLVTRIIISWRLDDGFFAPYLSEYLANFHLKTGILDLTTRNVLFLSWGNYLRAKFIENSWMSVPHNLMYTSVLHDLIDKKNTEQNIYSKLSVKFLTLFILLNITSKCTRASCETVASVQKTHVFHLIFTSVLANLSVDMLTASVV
jgi:hypothetical protein